jgi:PAS domain S-box-containing protein
MDEQALVTAVLCVVEQHLDYDRGMILLADSSRARLKWIAGYGFDAGQKKLLESISFELDSENAKGFFQTVFLEKDPVVLNGISDFSNLFSHCPEAYQQRMSCDSMIAVAVVSEEKLLGVLVVENLKRKRTLTRSDVNLLEGIASETALGILKARSIKQLKASEKKYRELVENANSIILRCDIEGRVTFFNEFGQKLFGYEDFEILGKSMFGTVFPDNESNRELFDRQMKALRDNPEHPRANESECRTRTGQVTWIAWTYRPIFDAKGRLCEILCIGNDVTEIRRADIENRELQVRLERAKKMEALGTLAGGVAHDLNNVLSGVVAYPDLLLLELPEDSPFRRSILTIQKSGRKAAAIVEDLLTLARRGVVNKEVLDLNRLVNDYLESPVFENLHSYYSEVEVNKNLDEALFRIQGSPVHLTKMIMNLVSNAAEAIDGPGKIVVATRNRYVDRTLKGFEAVEEGMYVEFSVEDNGKGIEESAREHIFEPFYSKKVLGRSGTGLGMAVVWGTVKDHNGYIDIKSEVGRGTSVSVYIPVSVDQVLKEKHVESIDRLSGSGQKVLVVDDMEDQRFIASSMLEKLGYAAVTVSSGEEALEYLEWNPVDCVLLDMIMTGSMDGLDTFRRMRDIRPGLKTVIVSGFSETERVKEAQKLGAGPYVRKPYLLQTLGRILKRELSGEPDVQEDPGPGAS